MQLRRAGLAKSLLAALNPLSLAHERQEAWLALTLGRKLQAAGRDRRRLAAAMDANWREIYALAKLVEERHVRAQAPSVRPPLLPTPPPLSCARALSCLRRGYLACMVLARFAEYAPTHRRE